MKKATILFFLLFGLTGFSSGRASVLSDLAPEVRPEEWTERKTNNIAAALTRADVSGVTQQAAADIIPPSVPAGLAAAASNHRVSAYYAANNVSAQSASAPTLNEIGPTIDIYPGTNVFGPAAEGLKAGETLIVHQGTYLETNRMSLQVQGTAANPILIKGADGEARPLITRPATASLQNTFNIEGSATYITIKGLEITGNGSDAIDMVGSLSYITLEDLVIHDIDVGIGMHSSMHHLTIRRNHIYNTGINGGTGEGMYVGCNNATCAVHDSLIEQNWIHDSLPGTTQGDGIEVKVGSYGNIIRDNVIYNRDYPGILVYGTGSNPVNIVEGNVVWNCPSEGISALSDAIVRNNVVFNSSCGLCVYTHEQVSSYKNLTLVNNTLYNNDDGIYYRWSGSGTNLILANNAIYSTNKTAVNGTISGTAAANYVQGAMSGSAIDNAKFVNGGTSANAFVNAAGNDFWPKAGSPLRGTANATYAPAVDFNGTSRTAPHDVGAYATNGLSGNPGWTITQGFKGVTGGPTPPAAPTGLRIR